MLHPFMYDNAVRVNIAVEISVLNFNVAVRQRTMPGTEGWKLRFSIYWVYYATCTMHIGQQIPCR